MEEVILYWENKVEEKNNNRRLGLVFDTNRRQKGTMTSFLVKITRKNKQRVLAPLSMKRNEMSVTRKTK